MAAKPPRIPPPPPPAALARRPRQGPASKPAPAPTEGPETEPNQGPSLVLWHRWAATGGSTALLSAWTDALTAHIEAVGARLLFRLGGTVAAELGDRAPIEALRSALAWIEEAERFGEGTPLPIAIALSRDPSRNRSTDAEAWPALSRAQLLCNHARPGELVLDADMRRLTARRVLFVREIESEEAEGASIDRARPFRSICTASLAELRSPPLPPRIEAYLDEAAARIEGKEPRTLILRGIAGTGATELAGALLARARPPASLWIGSVPGAHAPLGSLRASLIRDHRFPSEVESAFEDRGLPDELAERLGRVAEGEVLDLAELSEALGGALLAMAEGAQGSATHPLPWVLLAPVSGVDAATLEALVEARRRGALFHLIGLQRTDSRLPRLLLEGGAGASEPSTLDLPRLTSSEAVELVRESLGLPPKDPAALALCRELAQLAGDTLPGLHETLRALVAGGDLIREGLQGEERWVFRIGEPDVRTVLRPGADPLARRLALLSPDALLSLQALCLLPEGVEAREVDSVLEPLGVSEEARLRAWEDLLREGLVQGSPPLPSSAAIRFAALDALDPTSRARLHGAAADALAARPESDTEGWAGELGWHREQAGLKAEAAKGYLVAARAAQRAGYHRAAARAAKAAHALTPRREAGEIEAVLRRSLSALYGKRPSTRPPRSRSERPSKAPPRISAFASRFGAALRAERPEEAEQMLEQAMAEGGDLSSIARLRAAIALSVGDLEGAARAAARASRALGGAPIGRGEAIRAALLEALIALAAGSGTRAVRASLSALAEARERADHAGEAAALATLSLCQRRLGRLEEAHRLRAYALREPV